MNGQGLVVIARDAELAELERYAHRVTEHDPALVIVTRHAGAGRTALVERFAATRDGPVLRAVARRRDLRPALRARAEGRWYAPGAR